MVDVILVDESDTQIGTKEKIAAHKDADLHRAFSVLVYNSKGEMLIHRRALSKYHAGGLWTNACCSHPMPPESVEQAVHRRMREELGYQKLSYDKLCEYIYKVSFDNGLTEHEYLHVYKTVTDQDPPDIDPKEIAEWTWVPVASLRNQIVQHPERFTPWFKLTLEKIQSG